MRYGFVVPYADAREFAELAVVGEQHGWDAVFTWEALWGVDAWVTLGAAAMRTERIRLGTLLTPASRWKPWDLATRVGTVDRLSRGRAVLGVGLGALHSGWTAFERDEGRRVRAARLDECLAVYDGLMRGQPFAYEGTYYSVQPTDFMPPDPPVQRPRPPVWVVGAHVVGRKAQPSLDRAARWDGLLPQRIDASSRGAAITLDQLAEIVGLVRERRAAAGLADEPYDVVVEADSTGQHVRLEPGDPSAWEQAGATWWVESWWGVQPGADGRAEIERRVRAGPPGR
jgi:alkanesulfonate monooxygenase SsuD/methylene tetrahydromethanopterin reductase-like flavin-dependent oxidoreductase (luciferase family)